MLFTELYSDDNCNYIFEYKQYYIGSLDDKY